VGFLKRTVPTGLLVALDSLFQPTGNLWQYTPSVFVKSSADASVPAAAEGFFFKCPQCDSPLPEKNKTHIECGSCGASWGFQNGIYNFKQPL
jgi:hypothetical protein